MVVFPAGSFPPALPFVRLISREILSVPQHGGVSQLLVVEMGEVWTGGGI